MGVRKKISGKKLLGFRNLQEKLFFRLRWGLEKKISGRGKLKTFFDKRETVPSLLLKSSSVMNSKAGDFLATIFSSSESSLKAAFLFLFPFFPLEDFVFVSRP